MCKLLQTGVAAPSWVATPILHSVLIDDGNAKSALQFYRDDPKGDAERLLDIAAVFDPSNPRQATDLRFEYATQRSLDGRYHDAVDALGTAARKAAAHNESAHFSNEMRRFAALHSRRISLQKLIKEAAAVLGLPNSKLV